MKVDIVKDVLEKHTDEEIIAFLLEAMKGVQRNYKNSVELKQPETLWSSLGDIIMVTAILREIKARNDAVALQKQL